jgi:hypothetical protein
MGEKNMRKICLTILLCIALIISGCSTKKSLEEEGISISAISSSIGAVGQNTNDFENQSFKYTITLTNNEEANITVVSITPMLSENFASLVSDKNVTVDINKTISKDSSIDVSGEIIFNTKGLSKEQIISLEPFVKEVKITEERTIPNSF